jgi:hypothetical protein
VSGRAEQGSTLPFCRVCGAGGDEPRHYVEDICPLNEEADRGEAVDPWEYDNCLDLILWQAELDASGMPTLPRGPENAP